MASGRSSHDHAQVPTQRDYDTDPGRYRLGTALTSAHGAPQTDLHSRIVRLLHHAGVVRVLDVGCGAGALAAAAAGMVRVIGVDAAATMIGAASRHGPAIRAEATALPVADGAVDAVVAVNVLDHLDRPGDGLLEAHRVLRRGGLLVAGTISRADSPELAPFWRPARTPFDTEDAPAQVAAVFGSTGTQPWDAPLITLPDRDAVRDYLRVRFVPPGQAERLADALVHRGPLPLPVTKRGALVLAHRA
ncbi:MAG: methyltransferase domain-containing protein [Pseudonocardia sp.]